MRIRMCVCVEEGGGVDFFKFQNMYIKKLSSNHWVCWMEFFFSLQFEKASDQEELNKAISSFQHSLRKNINPQNLKRFVKSFMK